jgi:hypothetical protein
MTLRPGGLLRTNTARTDQRGRPGVDLGVLFAELDLGSQRPSETEFVAIRVN